MELPLRPHRDQPQTWEVGVDFGSTFSAAATCLTSESTEVCTAGEVKTVQGFPRAQAGITGSGAATQEVPTKVRYEQGGEYVRWGWDVVSIMNRGGHRTMPGHVIELFKPGLDDDERNRDARRNIEEALLTLPFAKSVDEVVEDFLAKLLSHIRTRLSRVGYRPIDNVHFTCTVPAMWSIRAKRRTIQAIERARESSGFVAGRSVKICSEPEAATAYVIRCLRNIQWKEGDVFIVCDAGGVTVDLVTYIVTKMEPLCLREVVRGDGRFCGSSYLNQRFREQVEERLKEEKYFEAIPDLSLEELIQEAVDGKWEREIKPGYPRDESGEDSDQPYDWLKIPGLRDNREKGFRDRAMPIMKDHIEAVFAPILEDCWELVLSQITLADKQGCQPTRILLVGGFGGSERLRQHLQAQCDAYTSAHRRRPIIVLVPDTPGNAIAAGAIYRTLNQSGENMVEDYVSRASICISAHDRLDRRQNKHKNAASMFDQLEGRNYVHDCARILLETDEMIPSTGLKRTHHLHCTITADEETLELTVPIYVLDRGHGKDGYPLSHPANKGFERLETVSFAVDVAPIRDKLERRRKGTPFPYDPSSHSQRREARTRRGNQRSDINDSAAAQSSNGTGNCSGNLYTRPASSSESVLADGDGDHGLYYFWVDYRVEIEFKDGLMNYHLRIDNIDRSYRGVVNLASVLEPCPPEND